MYPEINRDKSLKRSSVWALLACLVLFIAAMIFITLPDSKIRPSDIKSITIIDLKGNPSMITDKAAISRYIEAFNSAEPLSGTLSENDLTHYEVQLTQKNVDEKLKLRLLVNKNLASKEMWISQKDGEYLKLNPQAFDFILLCQAFDPLYPNSCPPDVSLNLNGAASSILPSSYQWQIRKTDKVFYPSKIDYLKGNVVYSFDMNEKSQLGFQFDMKPDLFQLDFYKDDLPVYSSNSYETTPVNLKDDGIYRGVITAEWVKNENRDYFGKAVYEFEVKADYPTQFDISKAEIEPGELLVIRASNIAENQKIDIKTNINFEPKVYGDGNIRHILLPVSYYHESGKSYNVTLASGGVEKTFEIKVAPKEFITQYMTIDTKIAKETRNEKSSQELRDKLYPLKPVSDPEQYWEGAFLQPVEGGRVTPTDFGKRRHVNNAPTSYRHNGLDIGHDTGAPIMASNNGRVLIAEYLIQTGNTIIIEHGYGLKTWYYHMSELKVAKDDMVKKGDIIGLVGSTGFSTSPHLHFSTSINEVYINPMTLFEEGVPFF